VEWSLAFAVDETTRIRFVVRILFNNLASGNACEDLFDRNPVGASFFVSMICDPNATGVDGSRN
jgi:hypothetical protein